MERIHVPHMMIEITRECNLECDHCLRGEQEMAVVSALNIKSLFSQTKSICLLTLTGGEPALYPKKIQDIITLAKAYHVNIENFYIATNGTIASAEFIRALMDLWLYCSENETSCVDVSNDVFHEREWEENWEKLSILRFVHKKYKRDDFDYHRNDAQNGIIDEGRGLDWGGPKNSETPIEDLKNGYDVDEAEFYLNCKGNIIVGCNWSYSSQNEPENILCHVSKFGKVYNELTKQLEEI